MTTSVSIFICTRNRAESLRETLTSLAEVEVPAAYTATLTVIDNGSTDHTEQVVRAFQPEHMDVRYVYEDRPGLSAARNCGIRVSDGEILLFTDDDTRLPHNWIEGMCTPIVRGEADAVAGGVKLANHVRRPWMRPWNTGILAETATLDPDQPQRMVGANMAFHRRVLEKVPGFDTNIGPGTTTAGGEETLFSLQLREAGYRIVGAFDVVVEHHINPDRLTRDAYIRHMKCMGITQAYIQYHWKHGRDVYIDHPLRTYAALAKSYVNLGLKRLRFRQQCRTSEGLPRWEYQLLLRIARLHAYLHLRGQPRHYERFGLKKRPE